MASYTHLSRESNYNRAIVALYTMIENTRLRIGTKETAATMDDLTDYLAALPTSLADPISIINTSAGHMHCKPFTAPGFADCRNRELLEGSTPLPATPPTSFASQDTNWDVVIQRPNKIVRNWAQVAAMTQQQEGTGARGGVVTDFGGLMTTIVQKQSTVTSPAMGNLAVSMGDGAGDCRRVVWICDLPSHFQLRDVSALIQYGPIAALIMHHNVSSELPGRSACITFQSSEQATAFLAGKSQKPALPQFEEAFVCAGEPVETDNTIMSMSAPTFARRRVKWSRSRLFYSVSLNNFKNEIYKLVNKSNVEFIHFYNPGEATAIFSSVKIATKVLNWFNKQKTRSSSPYCGVQVAFARDFNEAKPEKLWTAYDKNGRVRRVTNEKGINGLFEGPTFERIYRG